MLDVQRIWRIATSRGGMIEVRLWRTPAGDQRVLLEQLASDVTDEAALDLDAAQAVAQAVLEACEIARAVGD
jgi:hypothetical protein